MKKILMNIMLFLSITYAKPCMTDIYFGNGIWSKDKEQQLLSKRALRNIVKLDKSQEGKTYNYKLAYNPGNGITNDLIETYWQLRESGQITDGYFMATYIALSGQYTANAFVNKLLDIVTNYNAEVSTMHKTLQNASFNQKHNVLFVGHSQGNLFGNKMYTLLTDKEKKKFRMVSVGTVADKVAGNGSYVNIAKDYVVNSIPNSLKGNFDGRGHDFQGVYLNIDSMRHFYDKGSVNAGAQIATDVRSAYDNLMQTTSCQTYWAINMKLHTDGYMTVFGYPIIGGRDVYVSEEIGTVDFKPYLLTEEQDQNGQVIKRCNVDPLDVKRWGDIDLCYGGSSDDICGWKAGEIYSRSTLEARKNLQYIMVSKDFTTCIPISHGGELYELTKDLFE